MNAIEYLDGKKSLSVKCPACQKIMHINSTSKNLIVEGGIARHKKCKTVGDEHLLLLKDAILHAFAECPANEEVSRRGLFWIGIMGQIRGFIEKGFTYEEQLYSFNLCIKRDKVYYGYGRLNRFIDSDILQLRKYNEAVANKAEKIEEKRDLKKMESILDEQCVPIRVYNQGRSTFAWLDEEEEI